MSLLGKLFGNKNDNASREKDSQSKNKRNDIEVKTVIADNMVHEPKIPAFQGDYAKAVFLYATSKSSPIKANADYVRYLLYECGIKEPAKYHRQMIEEGYLRASTVEDMIKALKTDTLREILKRLALPAYGNKAALVERILGANDEEVLLTYCRTPAYVISEKGKQFLKEHDAYVMLHKNKNWEISWKDYDACRRDGYGFYDVIWEILNERLANEPTIGLMRNDYYHMYEVLRQEGKRKSALEMLLRVIYLDFSGVEVIEMWKLYSSIGYDNKEDLDTSGVPVMVAPGLMNALIQYKDVFEPSVVDRVYEFKLPFCCCDQKLFLSIISSVMDGTYEEEAVSKKLKAAYRKHVKERW